MRRTRVITLAGLSRETCIKIITETRKLEEHGVTEKRRRSNEVRTNRANGIHIKE